MTTGARVGWIGIGLALAVALACTRSPVPDNAYFPLAAGRTWTYALSRTAAEEDEKPIVLRVESMGPEEVGGVRVTRERIDLDGESHFLFVGVDQRGVFRYATQSPGEAGPSIDSERDYFLTVPLQAGSSWRGKGAPTFADVVDVPVEITSTVVGTDETVRTPAGEFTGCVKVRVTGSAEVREEQEPGQEPDPLRGTFTLEERTWYAKDVGVVKSVILETFGGAIDVQRIEVTTELQAFTR